MAVDWVNIGKSVLSHYNEMKYNNCKRDETFADKFVNEMRGLAPDIKGNNDLSANSSYWFTIFGNIFELRRVSLTRLFSTGNNWNGVDTLVEFCDYYEVYYTTVPSDEGIHLTTPEKLLHIVFNFLTEGYVPFDIRNSIWQALCVNAGYPSPSSFTTNSDIGSFSMVIMADADLQAATRALINSQNDYFQVTQVLVQEPIMHELHEAIRTYDHTCDIDSSLFVVFRNIEEAIGLLNSRIEVTGVSVWSENVIAAKNCTNSLQATTVWLNVHGRIAPGFHAMINVTIGEKIQHDANDKFENPTKKTDRNAATKRYDNFWGGSWHLPGDGGYWLNEENIAFAEATKQDFKECRSAAMNAGKSWRSEKLSARVKVLKQFAQRLIASGNIREAEAIRKYINRPLVFDASTVTIVRDGEAEIVSTRRPVGCVIMFARELVSLLAQLTLASVSGNAVIVIGTETFIPFAPYCEMLASCGFPAGVINYVSLANIGSLDLTSSHHGIDAVSTSLLDRKITMYKSLSAQQIASKYTNDQEFIKSSYKQFYRGVTSFQSVWLQCQ